MSDAALPGAPPDSDHGEQPFETVGELAQLYLGNILYAIELAALTLDRDERQDEAAFYRGIARKLAEAHGRAKHKER